MIGPPGVAAMFVAEPLSSLSAPSQIHGLWEPYVARGKVALLDGDPGVGKSLLTLDLAARLSRGLAPPTGAASGRPHVTLILSAEDDIAAMRPRAEAAGADLNWIITVTGPGGAPLVLPDRLADLEAFVCSTEADLVVIDPVMAFLAPGAAANVDQCVRRALNPLAVMAARHGCAILLVRHLCKSDSGKAVLRGQGSIGFVAAARTAMLAARHPADPSLHVLAVSKSNATVRPPSLGYSV
jgi:RecA-family ATPase